MRLDAYQDVSPASVVPEDCLPQIEGHLQDLIEAPLLDPLQ